MSLSFRRAVIPSSVMTENITVSYGRKYWPGKKDIPFRRRFRNIFYRSLCPLTSKLIRNVLVLVPRNPAHNTT